MSTILTDYDYPDFARGIATRAWARLRVASWKTALAATRKVRPPEEAGAGNSHTAPAITLPIRTVPESEVDGKPTINTAVRRLSLVKIDAAEAERAVRKALY